MAKREILLGEERFEIQIVSLRDAVCIDDLSAVALWMECAINVQLELTRIYGRAAYAPELDDQAVVVTSGDVPLGMVVFSCDGERREIFVGLAWVAESHRTRGMYRAMLQEIYTAAAAFDERLDHISCAVYLKNELSLSAHEALGFTRDLVWMTRPLPHIEGGTR